MGFYTKFVYPRILRFFCSRKPLAKHRKTLLSQASGEILEIGFGTGLNLPHYPDHVTHISTVDTNETMHRIATNRLRTSPIEVRHFLLKGDRLPMADATFDTVVSTWTLCTIRDVSQALTEIHRVLRPGGQLLFLEHGLSNDLQVQRWQRLLNPVQKAIAAGCHLNRDITGLVSDAGLSIESQRNFYLEETPKFGGYMYEGKAIKR